MYKNKKINMKKWLMNYLMVNEIKNEILYTDEIFRYIRQKERCSNIIDGLDGKIDMASKHSLIIGYIKYLENKK